MNNTYSSVLSRLQEEFKKDIGFLGSLGCVAATLELIHDWLKHRGMAPHEGLADALFIDAIPFNAFGFLCLCLALLGTLNALLLSSNIKIEFMSKLLPHIEERVAQITSGILSFTLGFGAIALLHAGFTQTAGGLKLVLMFVVFDITIVAGYVMTATIARRVKPFEQRWVAALFLALSMGFLATLVLHGVN